MSCSLQHIKIQLYTVIILRNDNNNMCTRLFTANQLHILNLFMEVARVQYGLMTYAVLVQKAILDRVHFEAGVKKIVDARNRLVLIVVYINIIKTLNKAYAFVVYSYMYSHCIFFSEFEQSANYC